MKLTIVLTVIALASASCVTPKKDNGKGSIAISGDRLPAGRWINCNLEEAEFLVHLSYSISGAIPPSDQTMYMRVAHTERDEFNATYTKLANGPVFETSLTGPFFAEGSFPDGKKYRYGGEVAFHTDGRNLRLHANLRWDFGNDTGVYRQTWEVNAMSQCVIDDGRFHLRVFFEKVPAKNGSQ